MTLKRLMIILGILIFLAGVGIMWLWQYAYTPQGRAQVIIAQLKNDPGTLRGWMLQHHLVGPGFSDPPRIEDEAIYNFRYRQVTAAANAMRRLDRQILPIVIEAIHDGNRDVQLMAIKACGKFRDPAAIGPLAKRMREAPNEIPPNPTEDKGDVDIQYCCMDSLTEIGPEAFGPLLDASRKCDGILVQGDMSEMLAQKWGEAAVPYLIRVLGEPDEEVRGYAAIELGKLKDKRATDALIGLLADPDGNVLKRAAGALGEIGDPEAIPALLRVLKNNQIENEIRIPAAGALVRMKRDEGLQFLLNMAKSTDPSLRDYATQELSEARSNLPPASQPGNP
jgi:hypothetical protein